MGASEVGCLFKTISLTYTIYYIYDTGLTEARFYLNDYEMIYDAAAVVSIS